MSYKFIVIWVIKCYIVHIFPQIACLLNPEKSLGIHYNGIYNLGGFFSS